MSSNNMHGTNRNTAACQPTYYQPCYNTQYVNTHNTIKFDGGVTNE